MSRPRRTPLLVGVLCTGLVSGCAGEPPAPAPAPAPASAPTSPAPAGAASAQDAAACTDSDITVSTVRGIADALDRGPVLAAGVELFLSGPREKAAAPDDTGPEMTAARAEMVAAIDDLDAQAEAMLPPGGNATRDPVQLDPDRILAAAAELERLCGASRPSPG